MSLPGKGKALPKFAYNIQVQLLDESTNSSFPPVCGSSTNSKDVRIDDRRYIVFSFPTTLSTNLKTTLEPGKRPIGYCRDAQ